MAWYNEIDPFAAQWLRNLVGAGHVAPGAVDDRSIVDLAADDVAGPGQRHFFAGIGGWSYALRLAGVPDNASIWTASCPCQPFSGAGRRLGAADERHLWPVLRDLVEECRPAILFGEQVASGDGRAWFAAVHADLEALGYAVGAADLCAAGVGAPHIRQRLYFVAYADSTRWEGWTSHARVASGPARRRGGLGDNCEPGGVGDAHGEHAGRLGRGAPRAEAALEGAGGVDRRGGDELGAPSGTLRPWSGAEWIKCSDGKSRPVEPGAFPLAHGVPGRVGKLRAYGNAIVPQVAAAFIRAALSSLP